MKLPTYGEFLNESQGTKYKPVVGDRYECLNPSVLSPYYESKFNGEILIVQRTDVAYVTGGKKDFIILTPGNEWYLNPRFAVATSDLNSQNFKKIK